MKIIYIDESGNCRNWQKNIDEQPFYALSAICCDSQTYEEQCNNLRSDLKEITTELDPNFILGKGYEIKAKEVINPQGYWKTHKDNKKKLISTMLQIPDVAWLVVLDKKAHKDQYFEPEEPFKYCLECLLERIEKYLQQQNASALCIYDQDKVMDDTLHTHSIKVLKSSFYVTFNKILEIHLGNSCNSIGLQVADYYATCCYQYYKKGKPGNSEWWLNIEKKLYQVNRKIRGYGLKELP